MHEAAGMGHLDVVKCLVTVPGINLRAVTILGRTAIDMANDSNQEEVFNFLSDTLKPR